MNEPAPEPPERYFSLEEANAALVVIRPLLAEMLEIRERILAQQPEVWPILEKAAGNGGGVAAGKMHQDFERLDSLAYQVRSTGAILKDLDTGLVDFPAQRQGRLVYLCWRHGEPQVLYWHDVDAGFAGRQPL